MDNQQLMRRRPMQAQQQQAQRSQQVQQWQRDIGVTEGYVPNIMQHNRGVDEHMRDKKIISIYGVISRRMPQIYAQFRNPILRRPGAMNHMLPLYSKRGTALMDIGFDLLEFDMAGSTYSLFPKAHAQISGFSEYSIEQKVKNALWAALPYIATAAAAGLMAAKNVAIDGQAVKGMHAMFSILFGDNSRRTRFEQMKARDEAAASRVGRRLNEQDGMDDMTELEGIRKREQEHKTRYTIAGPLAINSFNEYTTKKSREYMLRLASDYFTQKFGNPEEAHMPERPICIKIKGHSRGGVTASEGAMMIRRWLLDTYGSDYADMVLFDIIQLDPVPGKDTWYETAKEIDYERGRFESKGEKYAGLGGFAQTTVVYSMHVDYPVFFTPQKVNGAGRIIITPFKHSSGLDDIDSDDNPVVDDGGALMEHDHRPAFIDAQTQKAYRLGALNDLERGVYILDEHNILARMDTYDDFAAVMDEIYKGQGRLHLQQARHNVIYSTVREWFRREQERQREQERRREQERQREQVD